MNENTNGEGAPGFFWMKGSLSIDVHLPSPCSAGDSIGSIGAGGQPVSGSVFSLAGALNSPPSSSLTLSEPSSPVTLPTMRLKWSTPSNATAFNHCIRSSPNQGSARTRSTAHVTKLPGLALGGVCSFSQGFCSSDRGGSV